MQQPPIDRILKGDEQLLWLGSPVRGVRFRSNEIGPMVAGLFSLCFGLVWVYLAMKGGGIFALFGIPVIALGLWHLIGRKVVEVITRVRTFYAVTDRRVIINSGFPVSRIKSLDIALLVSISLTEGRDGIGDVDFGGRSMMQQSIPGFRDNPGFNPLDPPRIQMIERPDEVYEIVLNARDTARTNHH